MTEREFEADESLRQTELFRAELEAVLADPAFARSPALSRLIRYLVEASLSGDGERLKSYTVAVEGLGRSPDFDPQVNTYARVLVARLRRRLDDFYREDGADRPMRLDVPQGSYEVTLIANGTAIDARPASQTERLPAEGIRPTWGNWRYWRKWRNVAALALTAMVVGVLVGMWLYRGDTTADKWQTWDFPVLLIETVPAANPAQQARLNAFADDLRGAMAQYEIVSLADAPAAKVTHKVRISSVSTPDDDGINLELVDLRENRQTVVDRLDLPAPASPAATELARREAFKMFGFSGIAHADARARGGEPDTPYRCWLRFSSALMVSGGLRDDQLKTCATAWYEQAPQDAMAISLYGWVLANEAIVRPLESQRNAALEDAARILEAAKVTNPRSRHILLALARVHGQRGDVAAMRQVLARLRAGDLLNPDFTGAVGVLVTLGGDPEGERLIDEAVARHPLTPPPRYYLGKFIAAMMRDDVAAAGRALAVISAGDQTSAWSDLARAAYYARTGQLDRARANWEHSKSKRSITTWDDNFLIDRMPAAPPVKQRMRDWLKPILTD
ncbi:MAG: hypothetical protein O9283_03170 [Sphingomonadaceae bacterium]|nr:hypothetical protein [Sphingomonadaceae bacterium]